MNCLQSRSPLQRTRKNVWTIALGVISQASENMMQGLYADEKGRLYLKAFIRADPEKDRAHKALIRLMAKEWRMPQSSIRMMHGKAQRLKIFTLDILTDDLKQYLQKLGVYFDCSDDSASTVSVSEHIF